MKGLDFLEIERHLFTFTKQFLAWCWTITSEDCWWLDSGSRCSVVLLPVGIYQSVDSRERFLRDVIIKRNFPINNWLISYKGSFVAWCFLFYLLHYRDKDDFLISCMCFSRSSPFEIRKFFSQKFQWQMLYFSQFFTCFFGDLRSHLGLLRWNPCWCQSCLSSVAFYVNLFFVFVTAVAMLAKQKIT